MSSEAKDSGATAKLVTLGEEAMAELKPGETIKQMVERKAKELLESSTEAGKERIAAIKKELTVPHNYIRPCHWCDGVMRETPTFGRLECPTCGAVSIIGRAKPVVHVEGPPEACPKCQRPWKRALDGGCAYCDHGHK